MNDDEVIQEMKYMIQRGINPNIHIVFKVLEGSLKSQEDGEFAAFCKEFAKEAIKRMNAGNN